MNRATGEYVALLAMMPNWVGRATTVGKGALKRRTQRCVRARRARWSDKLSANSICVGCHAPGVHLLVSSLMGEVNSAALARGLPTQVTPLSEQATELHHST
jgi:hypothetical protein